MVNIKPLPEPVMSSSYVHSNCFCFTKFICDWITPSSWQSWSLLVVSSASSLRPLQATAIDGRPIPCNTYLIKTQSLVISGKKEICLDVFSSSKPTIRIFWSFQALIIDVNQVFLFVYPHYIFIFSNNLTDHNWPVCLVVQFILQNYVKHQSVDYLGYILDGRLGHADPTNMKAVSLSI